MPTGSVGGVVPRGAGQQGEREMEEDVMAGEGS